MAWILVLLLALAARELRNQNKTLHTYSYVPVDDFEDWTPRSRVADERPFIQSTVDYVGNIDEHFCDFKEKNPYSEVDDWLDALEMPYKFFENSYWLKGIYEQASSRWNQCHVKWTKRKLDDFMGTCIRLSGFAF